MGAEQVELIGRGDRDVLAVGDGGHKPEIVTLGNAVLVAGGFGFESAPRERVPHRGAIHEQDRSVQVVGTDGASVPTDLHFKAEEVIAAGKVGRAKIEYPRTRKGGKIVGGHGRVPNHARVDGDGRAAGAGRPGGSLSSVRTDRAGLALWTRLAGGACHAIACGAGRTHGA